MRSFVLNAKGKGKGKGKSKVGGGYRAVVEAFGGRSL